MGNEDNIDDLGERIGRIEDNLDDIRLALWQIVERLNEVQPVPPAPSPEHVPSALQTEQVAPAPSHVPAASPHEPAAAASASKPFPKKASRRSRPERQSPPPKKPRSGLNADFELPAVFRRTQFWFNLIGIVLVLLGVVFLYKYSVDQGWITQPMKVAFGMTLGIALLGLGLFLHGRQRFFSQMMMGAGIATLYISGFAAFQLYGLIPYWVAVVWMAVVTLAAFVLSVQQDEAVLSLVGTLGGLATPLMLHEQVGSRAEVVIFACAVLAGSCAVYLYKGWRPLLWISVIGGWASLIFIYTMDLAAYRGLTATDKKAMQAGVIFAALAFWALPLLREWLSARNPERWPRPHVISQREEFAGFESVVNRNVHALSISTPFIALFFTREIWHLTDREWGWVTLGAAAIFGLAFLALWSREELRGLAYTQVLVDLALFTMAISLIMGGDARFIAITAEATALQLVSWKLDDRVIRFVAHGFFIFLAIWLAERLLDNHAQGTAMLNSAALSELLLIVAAAAVGFLITQKEIHLTYQLASYVALLALFLREFMDIANGQGYVTTAWGVCAVALLAAGILLNNNNWRLVALVTLFVVVAKLLLVDLSTVKAIWRVLLFIGFGGLFLLLSYFFQSLWKPDAKHANGTPA